MNKRTDPRSGISLSLRGWIHRGCQFGPVGKIGRAYYEAAARYCAERIQSKFGPEVMIIWTGGSTNRCAPGISDIDLVLLVDEIFIDETRLVKLRQLFVEFRRAFIPVGEIHLVPFGLWEFFYTHQPAPILWFESQRRFANGEWRRQDPVLQRISSSSRLSLALHHYGRAIHFLARAKGGNKTFYRAGFQREILKSIRYAAPGALISYGPVFEIAEGLELAFRALGILRSEKEIPFSSVPLRFDLNLAGAAAKRFATELFHRRVERSIRLAFASESWVDATNVPLLFTTRPEQDPQRRFFIQYAEFIQFGEHPGAVPIIIPPGVEEICLKGWSWGEPFESLSWQLPEAFEAGPGREEYQKNLSRSLWERLLLETITFLSKGIGQSRTQAQASFRRGLALCSAMESGQAALYEAVLEAYQDEPVEILNLYPTAFRKLSATLLKYAPLNDE